MLTNLSWNTEKVLEGYEGCEFEACTVQSSGATSTPELYGWVQETPQKEATPFYPRSPYAGELPS
jgi:GDP-D-mannose dehydratase